ncbi:MAG TPA: hypothetical protein VMG13_26940 [Trebonia sp.]|nr:hypothetical protein [Trebonia sp.]
MNKNNLKNFMIGDIKDRLFTKDYKSLENNLGFDSSLNHLNLQLNELNRKVFKYFENLTNTRIGLSNYYFANNIESFKIYKGRKDELMQELGIISSYKRAEEFKKACKDHPEALKLAERMVKQIMQFADKSLTMRKKIHLKKIITESITLDFFLKNPNLIEEINSLS